MFESAKLKAARARRLIEEYREQMNAYVQSKPYYLSMSTKHGKAWSLGLTKPIPQEVMLSVGDTVHNLRTALDHCAWELTYPIRPTLDAAALRKIKFPSSLSDKADFEGQVNGQDAFSPSCKHLLRTLGVHPGGRNAPVAWLSKIDNEDKHHLILSVVSEAVITGLYWRKFAYDGESHIEPFPQTRFPMMLWASALIGPNSGNLYGLANIHVQKPSIERHEVLTQAIDVNFSLSFAENEPFPNLPILPSLLQLADLVDIIIAEITKSNLGDARGLQNQYHHDSLVRQWKAPLRDASTSLKQAEPAGPTKD